MDVNKGENIEFSLQLIKSDGESVEEDATISYSVYDSSATLQVVSSQSATYNSVTQSYIDTLAPSASWISQEVGHYLVVWSVADTTDNFNSVYTEQLNINIDENDITGVNTNILGVSGDIANMQLDVSQILTNSITISGDVHDMALNVERILGLVHQNMVIDQTVFDGFRNLTSARVRIFREAAKTNVIATYRITATPSGAGRFVDWEQVEE